MTPANEEHVTKELFLLYLNMLNLCTSKKFKKVFCRQIEIDKGQFSKNHMIQINLPKANCVLATCSASKEN